MYNTRKGLKGVIVDTIFAKYTTKDTDIHGLLEQITFPRFPAEQVRWLPTPAHLGVLSAKEMLCRISTATKKGPRAEHSSVRYAHGDGRV